MLKDTDFTTAEQVTSDSRLTEQLNENLAVNEFYVGANSQTWRKLNNLMNWLHFTHMNPFSLVQKPTEITAADNFRVNMLAIHKLKK